MKKSLAVITVTTLILNAIGMGLAPQPVAAAPAPEPHRALSSDALPSWFAKPSAAVTKADALPSWFASERQHPARSDPHAPPSARHPTTAALPAWFSPDDSEPASTGQSPVSGPSRRPMSAAINESLLSVEIIVPEVASLGAPPGSGELYTAVVRNGSSDVAYGVYLTATHRSFMVYDSYSSLISRTGTIALDPVVTSTTAITWTPSITYNLAPGEVITLNVRLRAACTAKSGQRLEVGVRYNADPPPADPVELNTGAVNVTTGRGNLVVNKEPDLQSLGTGDFGRPITWTVEVQNTGLGKIYSATVTDTGGIDLDQPTGDLMPSATIPVLDVNEVATYTVVGTVKACNFTNVAEAAWPCGNKAGDATAANPVSSTVSVLFTPDVPQVDLQAASPITFPYCTPVTRTVVVTVNNPGGPAGDFRLDSTLESSGFLEIVTPSITGDWAYDPASGVFTYTGGLVTGTLMAQSTVTLTFDLQPADDVCAAGTGDLGFRPLYRDICTEEPFTGTYTNLSYQYAQDNAPSLQLSKDGPSSVASGEVFTYQVAISGDNPQSISGTIYVTDVLPSQFELQGPITPSTGIANTSGQTVTWTIDSDTYPDGAPFSETLIYEVRAITETEGVCGAGLQVDNQAEAFARPTCDACADFNPTADVDTIIENAEGIFPDDSAIGSFEVCDAQGFTITNRYQITGSIVVTWARAAFTEALGTDIGGAGALTNTAPLEYRDAFSLTIDGTDYTSLVTPTVVTPDGHLIVDLSPLEASGAPTQNFTLYITYTVGISEASLDGAVERTFYDWSQLYLPNSQSSDVCAGNDAFNQAIELTIGRGDLSVGLAPRELNRCEPNRAVINVNDNAPSRLADHIVVTFTSSSAEIATARNFATTGDLPDISSIDVVTDPGNGIITFTFDSDYDSTGSGNIEFDLDVGCTGEPPWRSGITFQTQCGFTHNHQTSLSHTYNKPNLILFVTPIEYTLREKEALWKFFLTNNGSLTATNVLVTNTIQGLSAYTYTADSAGVSANLPITNDDAVFTIDQIAPGQQRAVTVTAEAISCEPLGVNITAALQCLGAPCGRRYGEVSFNKPRPYLLTNNGQTADLPMCDVGEVIFTTKNASRDTTLYQLNITETLKQLAPAAGEPITVTVIDDEGAALASTNLFTPVIITEPVGATTPTTTTLIWRVISATNTPVYTWFQEMPPLHLVRITVPVRTSCVPPTPQAFAAADAREPCGRKLGYTEDAITLQTTEPNMTLQKRGKVAGGDLGETVYASPGQTITWQLEADNLNTRDAYIAHNVILTDTWPAFFEFVTATTDYTPTIDTATRTITWAIGNMEPESSTLTFYITGTVAISESACSAATTNTARLLYGCDDGCSGGAVPLDTAGLASYPSITVTFAPEPMPICAGDVTITIRNYGAPAYSNTLTVTIPSPGYVYSRVVSSGLTITEIITDDLTPQFRWDRIPGRTGPDPYEFDLVLRLKNSGDSGACPSANAQTVTATMQYDDHASCTDTETELITTTDTLDVLTPTLEVAKTPRTQTVDRGETITWTITVTNTGSGIAENVVITDVVSDNYVNVTATVGTPGYGTVYSVTGNMITWTLGSPIPASGGLWTATVSAVLTDTGLNRNVVTATAYCATGCETAVATDTAHSTLLREFIKGPEIQTGTIGSLTVFTFNVSLTDRDALYEDLTLTDTLPPGLGYVTSTLVYTPDVDGGGTQIVSHTPTITPGYLDSGDVIWRLGDLPGTVQIDGIITAVIQDVGTNYDGVRLTNVLRMTYADDGQFYEYNDSADVDIQEPLLHLHKDYITPYGCEALRLLDDFNDGDAAGWTTTGGTWSVSNGVYQQTSNTGSGGPGYAGVSAHIGDAVWRDYSLDLMMRSADDDLFGVIVRRQSSDTYYRFAWGNDTGYGWPGGRRLERFDGGTPTTLASDAALYDQGRWYHVEVRVEGARIRVYVDSDLIFDVTDSTPLLNGSIGLYSNYNTGSYFDDIALDRLEYDACVVSANDPITYTLTISNQGRIPGYDLVVTDTIPDGISLLTYAYASDDAGTITTAQPSPIPGATGDLIWGFNHLTPTVPFDPLDHTALTLTVVLTVSDGITANTVLPNRAALSYDAWAGDSQPIPEETRDYSGGSHSAAVRTVDGGIAKTTQFSPPPTATLGSLVTYTLIVPDPPISATLYDVVVTDTIDNRLHIESITTEGGSGAATAWDGQTVTATFDSIWHDTQAFITVTTRISDGLGADAGETITNSGVMTHATAEEITRTNTVSTEVGEPDLTLVKTSSPPTSSTVGTGDAVTYRVTITNSGAPGGPSPAYDLVFTDTLPEGMRQAAPSPYTITLDGAPVNASLYVTGYNSTTGVFAVAFSPTFAFSIPVGSALDIEYVAAVDADVGAALDLTNTAQVSWSSLPGVTTGDRDYGPAEDDTTVHTPAPSPTKAVTPAYATLGDWITYTIRVPDPVITATLYSVTVTDELSGALQLHDVITDGVTGDVSVAGNAFTVTYDSIFSLTQRLITVTAVLSDPLGAEAGDVITNVAILRHRDGGPIPSNEPPFTVTEPALTLVKARPTTSSTVGAGDIVTYTVRITNTDGITASPAYDLLITDTLPAHVTPFPPIPVSLEIEGVSVSDFITSYVGSVLTIEVTDTVSIPEGGTLLLTYHGRVAADAPAGLDLINHVSVTWSSLAGDVSGDRDYPPEDDVAIVHTGYPTLMLTKSAGSSSVDAGGRLTYTLTVTNAGIVSATGVLITDVIPVNATFVAATTPHTGPIPGPGAGSVITWPLGTLDIGLPQSVTMTVQVTSPLPDGTIITNTGWVTCSEGITDTDTVTTPVESTHVVSLTKTAAPDPVQAGGTLTYTLDWSVGGNEIARDVTISDTVPTSTTYQACGPAPCGESGGVVTWSLGDRAPGASGSVTFTVAVTQPLISGTVIYNAAVITTSRGFSDTDEVTTPVESDHALEVAKFVTPTTTVAPVGLLTYTLAYTVTGNEPAHGVTLSDTVPVHTDFVTATLPHSLTGRLVIWSLGDFLAAASGITEATGSVTMVVQAHSPLTDGIAIVNTVLITDADGETDDDTVTNTVESSHDITLTKAVDPAVATPGELLTYTLAYTVSGDGIAPDVTISDTTPTSTTFQAAIPPADRAPAVGGSGTVVWRLGSISPTATGAVTMVVLVDSPLVSGTQIVNAALITDSQGVTDTDEITTPVESSHALSVSKRAIPDIAVAGELLTYTIDWAVTGDEPAFNVTISDTTPTSTTFQACEGGLSCHGPGVDNVGLVTWSLGTQTPPASGVVTLVVQLDDALSGSAVLSNAVLITDTEGLTDTDEITTPVGTVADVAVTKSDAPDPVVAGTRLTYTLAVTNHGPSVARDVVVSDTLPPEVAFVSATPPPSSTHPLTWYLGTLAVDETRLLTIVVTVHDWAMETFTNTAVVTSTTPDDNPDNNDDDEPTTPLVPGLEVDKTVDPAEAVRSMPFTYTIRVTNTGQITFDPLVLTDTLPADFSYVVGSGSPTDPDVIAEPLLIWQNLGPLAPGESLTVSFAVTAAPATTGTYVNVVTAAGTTPGDTMTDTDDVPIPIVEPEVVVDKQVVTIDRDEVAPNYVTFTIAITNVGISIIDELPLVDAYDAYYLSFSDGVPYPEEDADDGLLTWYDLTGPAPNGLGRNLPPGEAFHVTTVFRIAHDIDVTTTNIVTVTDAEDIYDNPCDDDDDEEDIGGDDEDEIPTPIELRYFRAVAEDGVVRLAWATAAELGTIGFHIHRAGSDNLDDAEAIGYVEATGFGSSYSYVDREVTSGQRYWYWLIEEVDTGDGDVYGPVKAGVDVDALPDHLYLPLIQKGWGQRSAAPTPDHVVRQPMGQRAGLLPRLRRWLVGAN